MHALFNILSRDTRAVSLLALLCLLGGCSGYLNFAENIPNGQRVPLACKANVLWHGVGHLNVLGGGARNVFGIDFAAAGKVSPISFYGSKSF